MDSSKTSWSSAADNHHSGWQELPTSILRLLIADAEADLARRLVTALLARSPEWQVDVVHDPAAALNRLRAGACDVLLLDWDFATGMTGLDVCRRARTLGSPVPILMHSRFKEAPARVEALTSGADDFIVKGTLPVCELHQKLTCAYLLAHSRAPVLRSWRPPLELGPLTVHLDTKAIFVGGTLLRLPRQQQEILLRMARTVGEVVSLEELCSTAGLSPGVGFKNVHNELSRLRRCLGPEAARSIQTVRLQGYRLVQPVAP